MNRLRKLASQVCAASPAAIPAVGQTAAAAANSSVQIREIPLLEATKENFAPFGTILGEEKTTEADGKASGATRYASLRSFDPSPNFSSDEDTCLSLIRYEPRPLECEFMERHYKHTQVFIPLEGKSLIGFFAPPNDAEEPDLEKIVALRFDGSAGFVMHKGTWHEQPFPELPGTKAVVILRNETKRELKPVPGTRECHGEDIDKLDLKARHNVIFTTTSTTLGGR